MVKVEGPPPPPDAKWHRADKEYANSLFDRLKAAGISQRETSRRIGVTDRMLRAYASGDQMMPYTVQYALESLANSVTGDAMSTVHENAAAARHPSIAQTEWHDIAERPLQKSDQGKLIVGRDRFGAPIHGTVNTDGFGLFIQVADGIDVHRTPIDRVALYTLLDPPAE